MNQSDIQSPARRHLVAGGLALAGSLGLGLLRQAVAETSTTAPSGTLPAAAQAANAHFFPGFRQQFIKTSGATINTLVGGEGPPLLLIHGHPATHVEWHKIAPQLAKRLTVARIRRRARSPSTTDS